MMTKIQNTDPGAGPAYLPSGLPAYLTPLQPESRV